MVPPPLKKAMTSNSHVEAMMIGCMIFPKQLLHSCAEMLLADVNCWVLNQRASSKTKKY